MKRCTWKMITVLAAALCASLVGCQPEEDESPSSQRATRASFAAATAPAKPKPQRSVSESQSSAGTTRSENGEPCGSVSECLPGLACYKGECLLLEWDLQLTSEENFAPVTDEMAAACLEDAEGDVGKEDSCIAEARENRQMYVDRGCEQEFDAAHLCMLGLEKAMDGIEADPSIAIEAILAECNLANVDLRVCTGQSILVPEVEQVCEHAMDCIAADEEVSVAEYELAVSECIYGEARLQKIYQSFGCSEESMDWVDCTAELSCAADSDDAEETGFCSAEFDEITACMTDCPWVVTITPSSSGGLAEDSSLTFVAANFCKDESFGAECLADEGTDWYRCTCDDSQTVYLIDDVSREQYGAHEAQRHETLLEICAP